MASKGSTQALIKRRNDEIALMPPPPVKRIKRPSEVLDEDDYTDALSDIIARDYYPGLREAKAQEEYLSALDSKDPEWIQEAARKLQAAANGEVEVRAEVKRKSAQSDTPRPYRQAGETPKNASEADTPISVATVETDLEEDDEDNETSPRHQPKPDTTTVSLSAYQSKYTSEDNASFNTLLDKQNNTRRQKHSYLWTTTQQLPRTLQIEQRKTQQQKLLTDGSSNTTHQTPSNNDTTTPNQPAQQLTTGATPHRPAAPTFKPPTSPTNNLMFLPSTSVDETPHPTIYSLKQSLSKAGPKEIVHANTRFPPGGPRFSVADTDEDGDDTTSIHTSFIVRRGNRASSDINTTIDGNGSETPRVNGYSFVDEEEPHPPPQSISIFPLPSLISTQTTPNPFHLNPSLPRESLHHKLVTLDMQKKRLKQKETVKVQGEIGSKEVGNMTPAARKLLGRVTGTPVRQEGGEGRKREDWTPVVTPRRVR